ncbi:MAG: LytTR family transcriptional regulator DNA-binding domain-containing protein [Roseburia sp.]|nr:LytTR family transcriptional regulator DNA-binding domain-containing protein [Ruminococcus sp.]MCM1155896.1 LytTR family transcriptional regulator DNA-binding domain-containing protein [Roseburia sp.]MCM1242029.1 LytTR family transcriptional regulator DNA-binding domain-containing protein [Roseburia sp.]
MKALFVDDDIAYSGTFIKYMKEYCKSMQLQIHCDVCHDPAKVLDRAAGYDIFFLDIDLGGTNGLVLAKELKIRFREKEIIFVSFYESYVFKAINVKPLAFIRKSELEMDLKDALEVIRQCVYGKYTWINLCLDSNSVMEIRPKDLVYCQSAGHYVNFVFRDQEIRTGRTKLAEVEDSLIEYGFIRVHTSYLVNELYVDCLDRLELIMMDGRKIPISRKYKNRTYDIFFRTRVL